VTRGTGAGLGKLIPGQFQLIVAFAGHSNNHSSNSSGNGSSSLSVVSMFTYAWRSKGTRCGSIRDLLLTNAGLQMTSKYSSRRAPRACRMFANGTSRRHRLSIPMTVINALSGRSGMILRISSLGRESEGGIGYCIRDDTIL
jgi:hypothetical protein